MIIKYKLFELFDADNVYDCNLVSTTSKMDKEGDGYDLYLYTFNGKDNVKYYIRIFYYNKLKDETYFLDVLSVDFMDEEQYSKDKENVSDIKFKNTQKQDAVKIINTAFSLLIKYKEKFNPWTISFNCSEDRYKTYLYCVEKFLYDFIRVNYAYDGMGYFSLYNQDYYKISDDGNDIERIDNGVVSYSSE